MTSYNRGDVILNVSPPFRPGDCVLNNWGSAGLVKPSAVRGVLATVDKAECKKPRPFVSRGFLFAQARARASVDTK
jgi:hypothetical protein